MDKKRPGKTWIDIKSCQAKSNNVIAQNLPYSVIDLGLFRRDVEDAVPYIWCIFTIVLIYSFYNRLFFSCI